MYKAMIPETENPQEAKSVYPGQPESHGKADQGRYFMQSPQCWFVIRLIYISDNVKNQ